MNATMLEPDAAARLRRVIERIKGDPRRLDMHRWGYKRGWLTFSAPECRTVACIAGWTILDGLPARELRRASGSTLKQILGERRFDEGAFFKAQKILGLDSETARRLFYLPFWPSLYLLRYKQAQNAKTRTDVTVERIEHFIETLE